MRKSKPVRVKRAAQARIKGPSDRSGATPSATGSPMPDFSSDSSPAAASINPPEQTPSVTYVGALSGVGVQRLSYQMPPQVRLEIAALLDRSELTANSEPFIDELVRLIGTYQILRLQDRDTLRSEREAITHLERAKKKAEELIAAYAKAREYFPGHTRLSAAWSSVLESRPTHLHGIRIRYPDPLESLGQFEKNLPKLQSLLSYAASIPVSRNSSGGRPRTPRAQGFVVEFHKLAKAGFGARLSSLRRGPFKEVLRIALRQAGWHHADLRPLLDAVEKPAPRSKPPVQEGG